MPLESIVMKELHEIREKNHEFMKNMTPEEKVRHINEEGKKAYELYIASVRAKNEK